MPPTGDCRCKREGTYKNNHTLSYTLVNAWNGNELSHEILHTAV